MPDDKRSHEENVPVPHPDRSADGASSVATLRRWSDSGTARIRRLFQPMPVRITAGVLCCLGLVAFTEANARPAGEPATASVSAPEATPAPEATGSTAEAAEPGDTDADDAEEAQPAEPEIVDPGPVAGLSQVQVDNARAIVRTGHDLGLPRRALIIAVATAMQESTLLNRASEVLPESKNYPHQGTGWDHDSVGLFQQRTSSGWGPVASLMDPAYASQRFFEALLRIPGWQGMRLAAAAQAVQVSAFPEHYAQHESMAAQVVDAIMPTDR